MPEVLGCLQFRHSVTVNPSIPSVLLNCGDVILSFDARHGAFCHKSAALYHPTSREALCQLGRNRENVRNHVSTPLLSMDAMPW
jgi:hypothetical protein